MKHATLNFSHMVYRTILLTLSLPLSLFAGYDGLRHAFQGKPPIEASRSFPRNMIFGEDVVTSFGKITIRSSFDVMLFRKPIKISSSTIDGTVSANLAKFMQPIFINQLTTTNDLSAIAAVAAEDVISHYFTFGGKAQFSAMRFLKEAKFYRIVCHSFCDFLLTKFDGPADFSSGVFHDHARFDGARFGSITSFKEASFDRTAQFSHAKFFDSVNFNKAIFFQGADFSYASFKKGVSFRGTLINDKIDLSFAKLDASIDLSEAAHLRHLEKINVSLVGADISKMVLNYDDFQLYFPTGTSMEAKENTYTLLLKNFENAGLGTSYRKLYSEYREFQYLRDNRPVTNLFSKYFWDYGQDRARVFLWLGLLFATYTIINAIFYRTLIDKYCRIEFLQNVDISKERALHPVLRFVYFLPFSFVLTFILFAGGFLKLGVTITNFQGRSFIVLSYILSITAIGFSSLFFILSFLL